MKLRDLLSLFQKSDQCLSESSGPQSSGWHRTDGYLVFDESIRLTQEEWLHSLNLIRTELGASGNVEHMPAIDTWETATRESLKRVV